jgi:DNA ligase D-like protein (predicted ligase)
MPARKTVAPAFVPPCLPTLLETPPAGHGWLHEIKHDGFRTILVKEESSARAFSRNGHDWTPRYSRIAAAVATLRCRTAVFDGEAMVQGEDGRSDLPALQTALREEPHRLVFFAFDLLHLDGDNLTVLPLIERMARLADLIGVASPYSALQLSEAIPGEGAAVFAAAERMGLEGIVSKRAASRYKSGRSSAWLKTKCMTEGEFVVVGMEPNPGGAPFALLAREEAGGLVYAGSAFVTLPQPARDEFWTRTEAIKVAKAAVALPRLGAHKASFVRPELRVRARHLRGEGMLRHAALTALL